MYLDLVCSRLSRRFAWSIIQKLAKGDSTNRQENLRETRHSIIKELLYTLLSKGGKMAIHQDNGTSKTLRRSSNQEHTWISRIGDHSQ